METFKCRECGWNLLAGMRKTPHISGIGSYIDKIWSCINEECSMYAKIVKEKPYLIEE